MMFNGTFKQYFSLRQGVRVMVFSDTFNIISVCFRGLELWCLMTLSTIFQFVAEGQGYDVQRHFQQYFSLLQVVRVMVFNDTFKQYFSLRQGVRVKMLCDTFNNICFFQRVRVMVFNDTFNNVSVCFRGLGLWCLTTLSTIFQFVSEGQGYGV